MAPTFTEAYRHSVITLQRQASRQRDFVDYLDTMWLVLPHARKAWQRGMAAGIVAACYGIDLSSGA